MSEWRDIAWWDDYAVNDQGEVCRKKDGVIMKQYIQKSGYAAVYLKDKNGWVSAVMVHRIVAKAFLPLVEGKEYVDHINTIRSDNRVVNLRWADAKDNANNETTKKNRRRKKKQMTLEEFEKLHFNFVAHMSLVGVHTRTYQDDSGRLGYCVHTRVKKNYESGRSYIHYRIDEKVYKTKEKFVEALADFSFNEIPMYPKAMK